VDKRVVIWVCLVNKFTKRRVGREGLFFDTKTNHKKLPTMVSFVRCLFVCSLFVWSNLFSLLAGLDVFLAGGGLISRRTTRTRDKDEDG
jgi:hypothetical protein